jgi:hypothetical protein
MRKRRSTNETTTETLKITKKPSEKQSTTTPPTSTTEFPMSKELKEFISNAFNVNSNVTERFLPVAQMSPLFNHFMRQGEHFLEPRNDDPRGEFIQITCKYLDF